MRQARDFILDWAAQGRIPQDRVRRALEIAGALPDTAAWRVFLDRLLLWLGVVMLASSVVFFLAYNWQQLGRYTKFALVEGLVVVLLAVVWRQGLRSAGGKAALFGAALVVGALLALLALRAPGVAPAVAILVIGYANGNRVLAGFGILSLLGYLANYYYSLQATLLVKSALLASAGIALLAARFAMRRWWPDAPEVKRA